MGYSPGDIRTKPTKIKDVIYWICFIFVLLAVLFSIGKCAVSERAAYRAKIQIKTIAQINSDCTLPSFWESRERCRIIYEDGTRGVAYKPLSIGDKIEIHP